MNALKVQFHAVDDAKYRQGAARMRTRCWRWLRLPPLRMRHSPLLEEAWQTFVNWPAAVERTTICLGTLANSAPGSTLRALR